MKSFVQQIESQWANSSLSKQGAAAFARFQALGLPSVKEEDWKYSSLNFLNQQEFFLAKNSPNTLQTKDIVHWTIAENEIRLVFVNGFFVPSLSQLEEKEGIFITPLSTLKNAPEISSVGSVASFEKQSFLALNTALFEDGAFVKIPSNWKRKTPIHLIYLQNSETPHTFVQARNFIEVGEQSEVEIIERYVSLGETPALSNGVTEVSLKKEAVAKHYKIQEENLASSHLYFLASQQERGSQFKTYSISLGAKFARNDITTLLADQGSECHLNGLYWVKNSQHVDHNTQIIHHKPHCTSFELYKGVLDEKSHAIFNGKIRVDPNASQTVARQLNKNLLLSKEATVNSKPLLEIYNNDVKCNHGATIGKLDEKQIFYLRSRGISENEARALLTYAFAADVLESISVSSLKDQLQKSLFENIGGSL